MKRIHLSNYSNRHTLSDIDSGVSNIYPGESTVVETETIDTFIENEISGIVDTLVLRLDLEGYEIEAIEGAHELLSSSLSVLMFVELHPHRVGIDATLEVIATLVEEYEFKLVTAASGNERVANSYDDLREYVSRDDVTGAAEVLFFRE